MRTIAKKFIHKDTYIYALLSYLFHWRINYWQPLKYKDLNKLIAIYASLNSKVNFIQVGSNDGISNDPLYPFINKYQWTDFCIEPIPENFEKLHLTHKDNNNINLLNIAVGQNGNIVLYFINPDKARYFKINLPSWYNQLASFDKDLVVSDIRSKDKYEIIDEINVISNSFLSLINEFEIKNIDLLHIDTEGADWSILSKFPFDSFQPDVIIFEHNHISLSDYKDAVTFLKCQGYKLLKVNTDTFCYSQVYSHAFNNEVKNAYRFVLKN